MLYQVVKDAQRGGAVGGGGGGCEHVREDGEEEGIEDGQERRVVYLHIDEVIMQVLKSNYVEDGQERRVVCLVMRSVRIWSLCMFSSK